MRVGAIDCGTNSIRLLVADVGTDPNTGAPALTDIERTMEVVRLGHGVDRTGVIAPEAMERTLRAAAEYAERCRALDVEAVRFVATSASRDARNAGEFISGVESVFEQHWGARVSPEVISGDEEAHLSFVGATGDLTARGDAPPYLVVDLGGGSTEFVRGRDQVEAACSVNIGCVRLTERHLADDPPTADQLAAALDDIDEAIDAAQRAVAFEGIGTLVGLAGSITTVTAHALELTHYDASRIHLAVLPVAALIGSATDLVAMPRQQRAALGFMHPGRVDVIGAGALVWSRIVARVAEASGITQVVTSEHDILDGIAWSVAQR